MINKNKLSAFTMIELMISITIVAILTTIWLYTYVWYLTDSRDLERQTSITEIKSALKTYKQKRWNYPKPWNSFNITNNWKVVAKQWLLNETVKLSTMESIPLDPYTDSNYSYSITANKQEFQISLTLENVDLPVALLAGDYKTVSENVLPTIMLAKSWTSDVEIHDGVWNWTENRKLFIFDNWKNVTYTLYDPYEPYSTWEDLNTLKTSDWVKFWQNSDYRSCIEIKEAWKYIHDSWTEEYQITDSDWILTNTWCTIN